MRHSHGVLPLYLDRSINFFVNEAFQFAIPAALLITTGQPAISAMVFGLEWVSRLLFLFLGGVVVERFGPTLSARLALLARALAGFGGLAAVLLFPGSPLVFEITLAVCGILSGGLFEIGFIVNERLAANVVDSGADPDVLQSRLGSIDQVALILGPVLGGAVLFLGVPALFGIFGTSMAIGLAATRATAVKHQAVTQANPTLAASLAAVLDVVASRLMRVTIFGAMASNIVLATITATLASVTQFVFHEDPRAASVIVSIGGVTALVAILLTPRITRHIGYARTLWAGIATMVVIVAASTFAPFVWVFAVLVAVAYAGDSVVAIVSRSVRIRVFPRERYASLMSATVLLNFLPMPFAGLSISALVRYVGLQTTWWLAGLAALSFGIAAFTQSRGNRSENDADFGHSLNVLYECTPD